MVLKRPFGDEESCEHPWKQPRQLECDKDLPSFDDIVSRNDVIKKSYIPEAYANEGGLNKCKYGDRLVSDNVTDERELEIKAPNIASSLSWANSSTSELALNSEAAFRFSSFPGIFEPDFPRRPHAEDDEMHSSVVNGLPRKRVSIGPDHQADIPLAVPKSSGSSQNIYDDDRAKMMGTCVIPMPDLTASDLVRDNVGKGQIDCCCQDEGSVKCVRRHIVEAREKLIATIGREAFVELGFCDMGEVVATKWSDKDEHVFNEVVFSNPASRGIFFWEHLFMVFPSRTKKEIVSYYFNVFVLRRRGEQNRLDPLNIDSDDDEWQGSEDGDDELRNTEEDEDSAVESPEYDYTLLSQHYKNIFESGDDESCDNNLGNDGHAARVEDRGNFDYVSEACNGKSPDNCSSGPVYPRNGEEDHDLQDDSCTSYECQLGRTDSSYEAVKQECRVESDHSKHFHDHYDGLNGMSSLGYDMEPCDDKVWDVGFHSSCRTEVDLLSTRNMIEEVFGDDAWSSKGRDGRA